MKLLPIALLAATAVLLPGPTPLAGQKVVSVQVGAVRSTFSGSDHSHATILGRSVRAALAVPLTDALAIRVDAGYAEKGGATVGEALARRLHSFLDAGPATISTEVGRGRIGSNACDERGCEP